MCKTMIPSISSELINVFYCMEQLILVLYSNGTPLICITILSNLTSKL